ncbi:hypothetical protein CFVLMG6570_08720 [Campylobacter fetus subsp. venerealis LMG 6570 = CCUG 33900]|uniref:Uncharacterized protein n=2 Tax=Campylobacter fetus TaxID=196 RepID=A0AAE6IY30_CAMFE|nr:hypothetical protein CFV97608_0470 [Campylobacter fetus subsp. venerealis 97/608]OCS29092.1 hypothetical protein CFVCCUG33900_08305 [Campylobacter fetus subsp. venerealis LMG 6570 = CCUG 33900]PHJ03469.1 hypothetical protein IW21_08565 [Campylobacter fetus subsp. venerealis]QEL44453.1 hypothetical protein CFVT_0472 [Campylobacter fetus subsp. venerealis NCTC 10354]OCS30823.1 hypothetical protein CFVLMG6570_08720 [Campylobacter fetus subsp. venerealis LMG 6570 = CCUG 33900]
MIFADDRSIITSFSFLGYSIVIGGVLSYMIRLNHNFTSGALLWAVRRTNDVFRPDPIQKYSYAPVGDFYNPALTQINNGRNFIRPLYPIGFFCPYRNAFKNDNFIPFMRIYVFYKHTDGTSRVAGYLKDMFYVPKNGLKQGEILMRGSIKYMVVDLGITDFYLVVKIEIRLIDGVGVSTSFLDDSQYFGVNLGTAKLKTSHPSYTYISKTHTTNMHYLIYYPDGIYISPYITHHDFGNITEPKSISYTLFNNSRNTQVLRNTDMQGFAGLNIKDISIGNKIYPYEQTTFSVVALTFGDIELKANLGLAFSDFGCYFSFAGKRNVIFAFVPNDEYYEEKSLKTDIFTALKGNEKRVALAKKCKINTGFKLIFKSSLNLNSCMELLSYGAKQNLLVPLWNSAFFASVDISGATSLEVPEFCEFEVGKFITVISQYADPIFRKVLEINGKSISIDDMVDIHKGDIIAPLFKATIAKQTSLSRSSKDTLELKLEMKECD